jgi:hypothetical protein
VSVNRGSGKVGQRLVVHGEEAHRRAILGRHVRDGRAVGKRQVLHALAVELDELSDDALLAKHLGHRQNRVRGGGAFAKLPGELEADDLR